MQFPEPPFELGEPYTLADMTNELRSLGDDDAPGWSHFISVTTSLFVRERPEALSGFSALIPDETPESRASMKPRLLAFLGTL